MNKKIKDLLCKIGIHIDYDCIEVFNFVTEYGESAEFKCNNCGKTWWG